MTKKEEDQTVHIASAEVREGILDHQVSHCPTCGSELQDCFGLAGGGFGAYGFCEQCNRVVWKCVVDE